MAKIRKAVVGKLSGSLGDVVFHERYGKLFIRRRPRSFLPGTDPESTGRRSRFAFSVKLASAVYSLPDLAMLWRRATPKNVSTFNFIVGANTKLAAEGSVTDQITITPSQSLELREVGAILNA